MNSTCFSGAALLGARPARASRRSLAAPARAAAGQQSLLRTLEKKKLLSQIEASGLLSKLAASGLSLDKIEKLKLLSTAESLGALSLAEGLAFTSPASYVTACVPFLTLAGACVLFAPAGSEGAADVAAGIFALIGLTFVGLGAGVAALQADD